MAAYDTYPPNRQHLVCSERITAAAETATTVETHHRFHEQQHKAYCVDVILVAVNAIIACIRSDSRDRQN